MGQATLDLFRSAALVAATVTAGLVAGLFYSYACSVMPGLGRTDDQTFIRSMQSINVAIVIPLNNQLAEAGDAGRIADLAAVREHFEAEWVRWKFVHAVVSTAAFSCLVWTLVLHGRTVASGGT
jgi:uncharacterized membrane protein